MPRPAHIPTSQDSSGGRLVSTDGRELPLLSARLHASTRAGLCRVVLRQRFQNPYAEPLAVTYRMPLPADGAVSGYAFELGDRRIVGEVDLRERARERFEQAVLEGHTAGLVEQERSSLFTQSLGNVPPGQELVAELTVDQKLAWNPEGAWEWRFPTVVAPRYLGAAGSVPDADRVFVDVADRPLGVRMELELSIRDALVDGARPESPSHAVRAVPAAGVWDVSFADGGARLDRDVVVRWAAAGRTPGVVLDVARGRPGSPHHDTLFGLLTLVPPSPRAETEPTPRDLIILIDTSGSMGGQPLAQAVRICQALVQSLHPRDRLELIEFSEAPRRWRPQAVEATPRHCQEAAQWLKALKASGGTEMRTGIMEALSTLREGAQRQVVVITDGLIGAEDKVIHAVHDRLPASARVHVVGVGSAVNRSLTLPASRAGRGVELIVGLGEDPERAAQRIVARTFAPLVTNVRLSGAALEECAPARIPDLFAGAPALVSVRLRAAGGDLVVHGETARGAYEERITVPPLEHASGSEALAALFARERVEDLELERAAGLERTPRDQAIARLGVEFQIATRLTSWVAITTGTTVDPTAPTRREGVAQELPYGMSVEGLGLRAAVAPGHVMRALAPSPAAPSVKGEFLEDLSAASGMAPPAPRGISGGSPGVFDALKKTVRKAFQPPRAPEVQEDAGAPPEEARPSFTDLRSEPLPPLAAAERGPFYNTWVGILLRITERELVLELDAGASGLDWQPDRAAQVMTTDGEVLDVRVDLTRTTRAGKVPAGTKLRLVLLLDAPPPSSSRRPGGVVNPAAVRLVATSAWPELEIQL